MKRAAVLPLALSITLAAIRAAADPYVLRADAFLYTQTPDAPVGLLMLQGEDRTKPWMDTEAMVWAGTGAAPADAMVLLVRLHDPKKNAWEIRLGRQVLTAGAVRPIHLDGADARLRLPSGTTLEAFGGVPVEPQFGYHAYEWATGARVAQAIGKDTTAGISYLQRRDEGVVQYEEVGLDFASAPTRWFDLAMRGAYDLENPGLTEATMSVAARADTLRPELYATYRSPSRILPATSLFAALGDTPSEVIGAALPWKMFPRLDVMGMAGARITDGDVGVDATLRTTLRFDDKGNGALTLEMRRQGSGPDRWTGFRTAVRLPINRVLRWSTEVEVVAPDDPRGRGSLWPWALVALRWLPWEKWEIAGAVESASTPTHEFELNAMLRLSRSWGGP